jgi:tripartite-type tricarboxylate transporter receptor subunit TctC
MFLLSKRPRDVRVGLTLLSAALCGLPGSASAQTYPDKPVRVVVSFTAGGTTDILARLVGERLSKKWQQPVIVENKPGAGGNIGTEFVIRSAPTGYVTLVNSVGPIAINPSLYKSLGYDPLTDLLPVVQIAEVPNVLVVPPSVPANTVDELVAYAKANPGQLNYSSTGVGTSAHLSSFMLASRAGFEATHIPYKGADAVTDLLAGRVQFMFATIPSVISQIKAGKLKALAVSSLKRSRSLPEIPTVSERGYPDFEAGSWFGFFVPRGTPAAVIAEINRAVNEVLDDKTIQERMIQEGADPVGGTPEQFGAFVRKEYEKWKIVVRDSGATAR